MNYRQIIITAIILLLFTVVGTTMVAFTYDGTREKIAANERATLQRKLNQLLPPGSYDNDLLDDRIRVTLPDATDRDSAITVYRARKNNADAGLVMTAVAPDGYSGRIKMLVGIRADDTLSGVRVITHRETPGLGDAIDEQRTDWVYGFDGKSLGNPPIEQWRVKKDGGTFDQLTGATITPRAIVKAVRRTLLYYQANREMLYTTAPVTE